MEAKEEKLDEYISAVHCFGCGKFVPLKHTGLYRVPIVKGLQRVCAGCYRLIKVGGG